ncbi:hypothetical protein Syun_010679 [Stephania yunnanensis]|uniref:CRAL/TRIO N-terminal domain-containing protein n=1 Tax=Stephania yunnanensis TaxID=152371 RepID=A0AAP0KJJ9_9MAGN
MGIVAEDAIKQFKALMDEVDEPLKKTFQNIHQGYTDENLVRFLRARDWNVPKAYKMKPIIPSELYRAVRESHLVGVSGYTRKPNATKKLGRHVGTCVKILDMTGLRISALSQIKVRIVLSTFRRYSLCALRYMSKEANVAIKKNLLDLDLEPSAESYRNKWNFVVNVCCETLLQERTRRKIQVLQGSGKDELLKIMDYASLPHFCKREGSGSLRYSNCENDDCFSSDHPFHQECYNYVKQQAMKLECVAPIKQGSFHVNVPEPGVEGTKIAETIESEFHKLENGISHSLDRLKVAED